MHEPGVYVGPFAGRSARGVNRSSSSRASWQQKVEFHACGFLILIPHSRSGIKVGGPTRSVKGVAQAAHLHLIVVTEARVKPLSQRQNTSSQAAGQFGASNVFVANHDNLVDRYGGARLD
jgi:hypothetical protein